MAVMQNVRRTTIVDGTGNLKNIITLDCRLRILLVVIVVRTGSTEPYMSTIALGCKCVMSYSIKINKQNLTSEAVLMNLWCLAALHKMIHTQPSPPDTLISLTPRTFPTIRFLFLALSPVSAPPDCPGIHTHNGRLFRTSKVGFKATTGPTASAFDLLSTSNGFLSHSRVCSARTYSSPIAGITHGFQPPDVHRSYVRANEVGGRRCKSVLDAHNGHERSGLTDASECYIVLAPHVDSTRFL